MGKLNPKEPWYVTDNEGKKHPNGVPTQADIIGQNAEFDTAVQSIVQADTDLKARIVAAAQDLNFWGKRLGLAKMLVIEQVAEIFRDYAINVDSVKSIIEAATPPKKAKIERDAKEKAPDNRPISAGSLSSWTASFLNSPSGWKP